MAPYKRSTLQLDLKDLTSKQSTPVLRHLGLASVTAGALLSTYILINAPSASTTDTADFSADNSDDLKTQEIIQIASLNLEAHRTQPTSRRVESELSGRSDAIDDLIRTEAEKDRQAVESALETNGNAIKDPEDQQLSGQSPTIEKPTGSIAARAATGNGDKIHEDVVEIEYKQTGGVNNEQPEATQSVFRAEPGSGLLASINPAQSLHGLADSKDFSGTEKPGIDLAQANGNLPQPQHDWITAKVKKGDTLSRIFNRQGMKSTEAYAVAKLENAQALLKIRPGQKIQLAKDDQGKLAALRYGINKFTTLDIRRQDESFQSKVVTRTPEVRIRTEQATIWSSLLGAADSAGVDFDTVYGLTQIFGWQVDFARDIQSGDQFSVIFEELYLDDKKVGTGAIIAAELFTAGKRLRAVRHIDDDGYATYYAPNGEGIQGSFLRTPVKFGRVTSKFTKRRFHPILKKWRAHKGVDYGAPMGTPILSTGDGVIKFAGRKKGYGKTIMIRHGGKYTTLYAHMNKFAKGVRSGSRVRQGDVIGYVGRTGWATGPHLHYEFRVNNAHRNPLTVELPKSASIDSAYKQNFLNQANQWVARLDQLGSIPLAQNESQQ